MRMQCANGNEKVYNTLRQNVVLKLMVFLLELGGCGTNMDESITVIGNRTRGTLGGCLRSEGQRINVFFKKNH